MGSLAKLGEGFALVVVNGLQSALSALRDVPFLGDFADEAAASLEGVKSAIIDAGQTASMALDEGGQKILEAWDQASASASFVYEDMLGADKYSQSASSHWQAAKDAAAAIKNDSAETAENFGKGSAAITDALKGIRGFSLDGGDATEKPDWFKSSAPPPADTKETSSKTSYSQKEQQTIEERIGAMRGAARSAAASAAAERFEAAGQFRSAVRAQDRAQRRVDRAMESARVKDILGGKNMGEAYQDYVKLLGMDRMSRQDFEKSIRDQAKSPEERARAEQEAKKKGGKQGQEGGKSSDPMQTVTDIYKLLTERLPIRVLAA